MSSVGTCPEEDRTVWRCPDPKAVPELRGRLATWLGEHGTDFYLQMSVIGTQLVRPVAADLGTSVSRLAQAERRRVVGGDLYLGVSPEMTALAWHAGAQLPAHELYEHDLPSRSGFMVFAEPLAMVQEEGVTTEIVAVSWGVLEPPVRLHVAGQDVCFGADWDDGAVWMTFYTDPRAFIRANFVGDEELVTVWAGSVGPFLPDNELIWVLGRPTEMPSGTGFTSAWGQVVVAAWLLMSQPLAQQSTERAPRPARRRLEKAGLPFSDVRLVHVRRSQRRPTRAADPSDRDYSCRWWVGSHWRRYRCGPGRRKVERRYIQPYLAGPDDKPVRGTERVKVWDR
jgi:hypothetical protein